MGNSDFSSSNVNGAIEEESELCSQVRKLPKIFQLIISWITNVFRIEFATILFTRAGDERYDFEIAI